MVPARPEMFVLHSDRQAIILLEQAERKAPHRGSVLSRMPGADAVLILLESHAQDPAHLVFNVPVPTCRLQ